MTDAYETGVQFPSNLPSWQRDWYEQALIEALRINSILVPFTQLKEDFAARNTRVIHMTEVYDMEPQWNSVSEETLWFKGGSLDSRSVSINLTAYHNILKFSDYHQTFDFVNNGDVRGLVNSKIAQNLVDTLDILARNAFSSHPNKIFSGAQSDRYQLTSSDVFDPDYAEGIRTVLEEDGVPGVMSAADGGSKAIVCVTTPRVIHDIRTNNQSSWVDVNNYHSTGRKFNSEVGMWGGVRFIKSNRLLLRNYGDIDTQTALNGATVPGQGAKAAGVDGVYSPGQTGATAFITVDDTTGFAAGDWITIHSQTTNGPSGEPVEEDGGQETRRIVEVIDGTTMSLHKPLLKDHADDDLVTKGLDVHQSVFLGGPGVVYGVGERPNLIFPPKIDDAMQVNRVGWRGLFKFQLFRPELFRVVESAGSAPLGTNLVF